LPRVLVTDASERAALAVIRSLGKKGIKVVAAESVGLNAGFLSKYSSEAFIYPSPLKDKTKFIKSMLCFVRKEDFDLLIPITDFTMVPIVEFKDEFEDYVKVAAPPHEVVMKAYDKFQTVSIAKKCGVPHPKTILVNDEKKLKEMADELNYPVVIKPRMKVFWKDGKAVMMKVTSINYAYNKEDLLSKHKSLMSKLKGVVPSDFFLVQEYVRGVGYGVEMLTSDSSNLIALFMHKRLHEYPVTGGASTLRVSVWNRRLAEYSIKLLKEMSWQGVAMVEFRLGEKNGDVNLLEVNGRFWGSLPLAINAGVDFPYLLYKMMVEKDSFAVKGYTLGLTERWLIPGDLLWLFDSLFRSYGNSKFAALRQFLSFPLLPDDIISLDDFMPTMGALFDALRYFIEFSQRKRTIYGEVLAS
jgi:predicted ATP-grasp superfamily ATP-dependent carboligase